MLLKYLLFICFIINGLTSLGNVNIPSKTILEEIPIGSLIVDLNEEFTNLNVTLHDYDENLHFTFLDDIKTSTQNLYFLLDPITGRLTSKRYLDRESMCLNKHCSCEPMGVCVINIQVLVIPSYNIINFNVEIQDINDNRPVFTSEYQVEKIPENVEIGHKIPVEVPTDTDTGINSIQTYRLIEKNVPFRLDTLEGLKLIVIDKLDREMTSGYNLTIEACDGGKPIYCARTRLNILLIDLNDNPPRFDQEIYVFKVSENELTSPIIGSVHAVDFDEDANSKIKYTLMNNPNGFFSLNEQTGEIRLKKWFDYEKEKFFTLNIEAKDSGLGSLQTYTTVEIHVQDLNDNLPEITCSFLNVFYRNITNDKVYVYIPENLEPNKFIAHVQIEDKDLVDVQLLEWKVYVNQRELKLPGVTGSVYNYLSLNKLNPESFTINSGNKILDRESDPWLNVSIRATDGKNIVYYNFTIELLDLNDNSPKLDKDFYELNINENNYVDQLIHKFDAQDPDAGQNGLVIYELEPEKNEFVYIEPLTGFLRASKVFDREQKAVYEFSVKARDNPKNFTLSKTTRVKCRLNIIDLNDNKPVIFYNGKQTKNLTLKVNENLNTKTEILKLKCLDKDLNSEINYSIKSQYDYVTSGEILNQLPFSVSPQDGILVNTNSLDRELVDLYEFEIVCSDGKFNTSLYLKVIVNDLNDNCPRNLYKSDEVRQKFVLKDNITTLVMFKEYYTDDDLNSNLKFELIDLKDILHVTAMQQDQTKPLIYELKIQLKNTSLIPKMGRYPFRVKISDSGLKPCEIIERFVMLVGDETHRNESLLLQSLKRHDRNSSIPLVVIICFFVSISIFLVVILIVCMCKKNRMKQKQKEIECIKVRNYRLIEGTSESDTRLSYSTDPCGDSMSSHVTFTKDTTSPSSGSSQQLNIGYYQLSSFVQKQKVNTSDYSTSIGSTEFSESSDLCDGYKVKKYDDVDEKQPCLVDIYRNENNYGHYLRSSVV